MNALARKPTVLKRQPSPSVVRPATFPTPGSALADNALGLNALLGASQRAPMGAYREIDVSLDVEDQTLWAFWHPLGPPSFTQGLLDDLFDLQRDVHKLFALRKRDERAPILFYVLGSEMPGIFNLGGDLGFFLETIRAGDKEALRAYAYACVEAIYNSAFGFDVPVVSIGVVEGDALGGGLEAALSFNVLIAERGTKMGLPEVLFNSFPGMGAYSFLARKVGASLAEKIILSGKIYLAEEFFDMGLVDVLAEPGTGREAARRFIAENKRRHGLLYAMNKVRGRVNPLTKAELRDVTDIWVDAAMNLDAQDLRRMELLCAAQQRRIGPSRRARGAIA